MSNSIWKNVAVAVQSSLATALPITSITKNATPVLTYTGTDPANGDYVLLTSIVGMVELEGAVVRVKNVNTGSNTFELDTISTDNFGAAATGGNAQVITFGAALSKALDLQGSGGTPEYIDQTTIHVNQRVEVSGLKSPIAYDFTCLWDPSDPGLAELYNADITSSSRAIRITLQNGYKFCFYGSIACGLIPGGSGQQNVTTAVGMRGLGIGTYFLT